MFFPQQHGCPKNRNSRFSSLLFHFLSIQTSKNIYKTMIKLRYPQQKLKQNQNLNLIWERESEHPQTHCHQNATHIYSNLRKPTVNPSPPTTQQPPTIATINLASIPTTKIQSKTKTHIQFKRENRSERKRESELEKENSPSPPLQTTTPSPSITKPPRCHRRSSVHTVDVDL